MPTTQGVPNHKTRRGVRSKRTRPGAVQICCPDCGRTIEPWDNQTVPYRRRPSHNGAAVEPLGERDDRALVPYPDLEPGKSYPLFEASDGSTAVTLLEVVRGEKPAPKPTKEGSAFMAAMVSCFSMTMREYGSQRWVCAGADCTFSKPYRTEVVFDLWAAAVESGSRKVTLP